MSTPTIIRMHVTPEKLVHVVATYYEVQHFANVFCACYQRYATWADGSTTLEYSMPWSDEACAVKEWREAVERSHD
jgi:hypothetical protein